MVLDRVTLANKLSESMITQTFTPSVFRCRPCKRNLDGLFRMEAFKRTRYASANLDGLFWMSALDIILHGYGNWIVH
jgi:hypothetical protein